MLRLLDLRGVRGDDLRAHLPRPEVAGDEPVAEVRAIIAQVREGGDAALRELTRRFDGAEIDELEVPPQALATSLDEIDGELREALYAARDAIEAFHRFRPGGTERRFERNGVVVRSLDRPVGRAGLYAPGGRAQYPSTVLMTAIPARVAGVGEVALCVPPGPDGQVAAPTLAAAAIAGVDEVYRVGGAQAIAAFAYGTETIRPVDVIAGPGNLWVSIAQREVSGVVGVTGAFAGPSEVVVIADETTPVEFAAVDIVVQAEHGPHGLAWLITWSEEVAAAVNEAVARITAAAPRRAEIEATLSTGGYVALVDGPEQALDVANEIAPEHLELCTADPERLLEMVRNAGAVFLGPWAPASVGDYLAGPSHVLPTFGSARYASALGVEDFVKRMHAIDVDREALARLTPHLVAIAEAEGLHVHALSAQMRTSDPQPRSKQ
jgi:histidinol dehydrogenase